MNITKKLILLLILACLSGCYTQTKKEEAKFPDGWILIDCTECNGEGKVTYGEDHWIVVNGLGDPGTYTCPICQGDKQLYSR